MKVSLRCGAIQDPLLRPLPRALRGRRHRPEHGAGGGASLCITCSPPGGHGGATRQVLLPRPERPCSTPPHGPPGSEEAEEGRAPTQTRMGPAAATPVLGTPAPASRTPARQRAATGRPRRGRPHAHHGERVAEQEQQLQQHLPPHVARELHHPAEPARPARSERQCARQGTQSCGSPQRGLQTLTLPSRSQRAGAAPPHRPRPRAGRAGDAAVASQGLRRQTLPPARRPPPGPGPETTGASSDVGLTPRRWTAASARPWTCGSPPYKAQAASRRRGGCKGSTGHGIDPDPAQAQQCRPPQPLLSAA